MNAEELYHSHEDIAEITVYRMFQSPKRVARQHGIELDDLFQYARTGLWKGCLSYCEDKGKFKTHAINNIRWHILERLRRETDMIKYDINKKFTTDEKYKVISIDKNLKDNEEYDTYHDIVGSDINVENDVMDNLNGLEILNKLDNVQKEIVYLMEVKEMQLKDIGKMWNMTGENVRRILNKSKRRLYSYAEVM